MRILISAYACEPDKGSEPEVGWRLVNELSKTHEVWVITRCNNRKPIEEVLSTQGGQKGNLQFIYYDLPKWMRFWKRGNRGIQIYYYLWQNGVSRLVPKLIERHQIELVHHLTFVKYWVPSGVRSSKVPFVWGPLGGGDHTPSLFLKEFKKLGRLQERIRPLVCELAERDPLLRATVAAAKVGIATTPATASRLKGLGVKDVRLLSQIALGDEDFAMLDRDDKPLAEPVFLVAGNLIALKGFSFALRAFAEANIQSASLWVVGEGIEEQRLRSEAYALGIAGRVTFFGRLPREELFHKLAQATALVHPSFHDSGGFVCLEAMAAGVPVICLKLGGPAMVVANNCGFKIPANQPDQVVKEMAEAMTSLVQDPELRGRMGEAGRRRAQSEFTWVKKANKINEIYKELSARGISSRETQTESFSAG